MFEFLLINHPLDCPVCDKGGECPLQDFSYTFGPNESRMEFPRRVFDGEGVRADVDFGPTLMLNRNRCILCTRCVRFMREVDADAQINIVDRGYGSEIATFQEEGVHSLLSGNLMDVCPVGAITTRDYRFKSRPWDNPEAVDTICTLCEKGCNTTAWLKAKPEWAKGARLARMTPRFNPEVNGYWMCDIGRFDYHWIEGDDRLQRPLVRSAADALEPASWSQALGTVAERVVARRRTGGAALPASRRTPRSRSCSSSAGSAAPSASPKTASRSAGGRARSRSRRNEVQDSAGGRAQRERRARPRLPGQRDCDGEADLSAFRADVEAGRVARALRVRSRSRRLDRRRVLGHRGAEVRQAAAARRPGRAADRSGEGRRRRAARRLVGREGRDLRQQGGPAAGVGARDGAAGRGAGGLADPRQTSAWRSAPRSRTRQRGDSRRARRRRWPATRPTPASRPSRSRARSRRSTWLQASNPSERWKWDFMFQDLPPVKFEGRHGLSSLLGAIPLKELK